MPANEPKQVPKSKKVAKPKPDLGKKKMEAQVPRRRRRTSSKKEQHDSSTSSKKEQHGSTQAVDNSTKGRRQNTKTKEDPKSALIVAHVGGLLDLLKSSLDRLKQVDSVRYEAQIAKLARISAGKPEPKPKAEVESQKQQKPEENLPCSQCKSSKPATAFSKNQKRRKNNRLCSECITIKKAQSVAKRAQNQQRDAKSISAALENAEKQRTQVSDASSTTAVLEKTEQQRLQGGGPRTASSVTAALEKAEQKRLQSPEDQYEVSASMFIPRKPTGAEIIGKTVVTRVTVDVNPADGSVDWPNATKKIRDIKMEGLSWLDSDLVHVAFGMHKLRITFQVVDSLIPDESVVRAAIEALSEVEAPTEMVSMDSLAV